MKRKAIAIKKTPHTLPTYNKHYHREKNESKDFKQNFVGKVDHFKICREQWEENNQGRN